MAPLRARVLTAVVDVGGDVHGGVVVICQALEQRILLEVGPYPVLPPLGLVGVQLECGKTWPQLGKNTICSTVASLFPIIFPIPSAFMKRFMRIYVSRWDLKALHASS